MGTGIFFTADDHLGHENVIRFCSRPFANVTQMDDAMIERWNERVGHDDVVYHLGDFTLQGRREAGNYFSRLHGHVRILGNHWHHDRRWLPDGFGLTDYGTLSGYRIEVLPPMVVLEFPELDNEICSKRPQVVVLCHYPMGEWDRKHHGAWHLHGHSHGNFEYASGSALDVGVDVHNFYPVSLEEVARHMAAFESAERGS